MAMKVNRKLIKFGKGVTILFVGDKDCGKTCVITRYINDMYFEEKMEHEESRLKDYQMNGENVEVRLVEFRQCEYNEEETLSIFRKANALICCFPSNEGMKAMQQWMNYVDRFITSDKLWFICQTKTDLGCMDIPIEDRKTFTFQHTFTKYFEVSSKTGENIQNALNEVIDITVKKFVNFEPKPSQPEPAPRREICTVV
ncbi:GTP-binding protein YPTM2, putative [Entamoeba invadens IP1]|uniref:GTP-binding protein YPTM2, putative n=1 Tax=Entamoeba invadens IP1 TaxID=370355 RepID=UPI0002C3FA47|nr:GTP-binding protein YPTM2, putative [Entamoeba invadens IP1]ELP85152.1 GTP-binding protein YPTM2, putative [Entamoeba invadens IP1]|eukprot:XP_004184498.1 GTP-binding protein YPTM2, putative [Entamoeba invadens IP1]